VTGWRLTDADWNSWPDGLDGPAHARQTAELGLAGIELGVYDAAVELSPGRLAALAGSPVTDILLSLPAERWPTGALSGDRPARDRLVEQVRACAEVCRTLGLPVLGLWPGADPVGADVVEGLRRVVEAAGDVRIAVEYKPDTAVATAAESDADLGGGDDDLPCGRVHDLGAFVAALDASGFQGTASFDLYGAVVAGVATGRDAVRESRDHVLSRRG
jgi:sugar phosphate isomerase/epimerase